MGRHLTVFSLSRVYFQVHEAATSAPGDVQYGPCVNVNDVLFWRLLLEPGMGRVDRMLSSETVLYTRICTQIF